MNFIKKVDKNLENAINNVVANKNQYVMNPQTDFTRKRKFTMKDIVTQIISMNGGTLKKELYDLSKIKKTTLTPSAFVQQRSKISSAAFKDVLKYFNESCKDSKTYRGYRLIAVDGSDINCPRNTKSENYFSTIQYPKGYNQIHLNAIYDVCNRTYIDIDFQPRKQMDERQALIRMLKRNKFEDKTLIIADRGYESYNMFAHLINTNNVEFLCRVKHKTGAMFEINKLPKKEVDVDIKMDVATTQTNEDKRHGRRFIQTGSKKGKSNSHKTIISNWDFTSPYTFNLRVVRILLDTGEYETLVTTLKREEFSLEDLKEIYHMRWNIETSFRDLKYTIGLTHLHSKKDDLILQEIYAAIIMYNYCSRISGSVQVRKQQKYKYAYKINFVMAVYICKIFYKSIKKDFRGLICDICEYAEPIRPGRKDERNIKPKRFAGFIYRVAA